MLEKVLKTVAQVIEELSRMPQNMRVLVSDRSGRVTDFDDAEVVFFPKGDFPPLDDEEIELDGVYVVIHQKSQMRVDNLSAR
jgi:hypothetical protein